MKKRKIIAKLMVLSMIISNVSGINVQATDNIDVQNDNSIEYNVDTENSETFEESNVDKNIISNETIENDDLISNENEILKEMEEVEEINEESLDNEINEEVNYDESEVISEEVTIISPMVSRAAAIGNVNILSSDSTTVAQAEAWARAKGATEEFIGLASLYQKYASSRGGVNWVVAYVQAAKETGYGKFGGVLDASYHNPCGLKNSSGGADEDPNAHKRFDNWDQGIIAHLDHLALYAGAAGYPKTNYVSKWQNSNLDSTSTYDPRHFAYLKGRATTVNDLGGQWAPSSTYGVEIFRLYCDLTGATYLPAVSNLENPQNNATIVDGKLRVSGWALHPFGIKEVKVTLDGVTLGNATYGVTRTDVSKIYSGYFNGSQCGFDSTFELNNITNGVKTLKVQIIANDGTSTVVTRNITVQKNLQARSCLDAPVSNATVTTDSLSIRGWALNSNGIKSVEVFIDNTSYGTIKYGVPRTDVNKVYPGYPSGDNSGFDGTIDISSLSNGNKTLKVVITGNDGTVQTINRAITVKKVVLEARSCLDEPTSNATVTTDSLLIKGWALNSKGIKSVEAFIDNISYGTIKYGVQRTDVNKVYPGYPSGDNSGFDGTIDISSLSNGNKTLKVVITGNDGTVQTINRAITVKKVVLEARSCLDEPTSNATVTTDSLLIKGWALNSKGIKSVEAFIDNISYGTIKYGVLRTDVNKVYPGYPTGDNSGFDGTIDISKLDNGNKTLKIVVTGNDGTIQTINRTITVKKSLKEIKYNIEEPSIAYAPNGKLTITGWAISMAGIKSVSVSVDGKAYGGITYGLTRTDVNRVYPTYTESTQSGFKGTIDLSSLSDGNKQVTITIIGKDGAKAIINKTINKVMLTSRNNLDSPAANDIITDGKITVSGWALSEAGTKEVRVSVDGKRLGTATINVPRVDVYNAYPYYSNKNAGYEDIFDVSSLGTGIKTLVVEIEDNNGKVQTVTRKFTYGAKKVVYVDPGHDYGGDKGAIRVINGVTYDETTLNIEVAEYLRTELINRGYEVIMARRMGERPTSSNYRENLWNRINAANNANADFYISIHQNTSTTTSANGVEAYYSSVKPDSLNDITYKLNTSKAVAASISSGIASALSMTNRGAKDEEFMVVKYTNMPAVLVECGFISNENEAKKISDSSNQKKIASVIADSIHNALK